MKKNRPKLGDRVEYTRGRGERTTILEGTIIAVSETGVHYLLETDKGIKRRIGLSRVVEIIEEKNND